jgi:hypothetical protein
MRFEQIKFYQTGTFAVGNRILDISNRARAVGCQSFQRAELRS